MEYTTLQSPDSLDGVDKVTIDCFYESQFSPRHSMFWIKVFQAFVAEVTIVKEVLCRFSLCTTNGANLFIHHSMLMHLCFVLNLSWQANNWTKQLLGMAALFHTKFAQHTLSLVPIKSLYTISME